MLDFFKSEIFTGILCVFLVGSIAVLVVANTYYKESHENTQKELVTLSKSLEILDKDISLLKSERDELKAAFGACYLLYSTENIPLVEMNPDMLSAISSYTSLAGQVERAADKYCEE